MIYYAIAFALTLVLCKMQAVPRVAAGGVRVNTFPKVRNALWAMLPLIFLALFRWNVGADSVYGSSYWEAFHLSAEGLNPREFAPGFFWFMRFFAELEIPFFWFLFFHGVLFFTVSAYAIQKSSVWGTWSVALFFLLTVYFDSYSSLRQSLAEAFCLIGWAKMGTDRNGWKKDLSILSIFLISGLFHSTGWMNIPVYLLCKLRFRRRIDVLLFAIIAVAATPVLQRVIPIVMDALSNNEAYTTRGLARINIAVSGLFFALSWLFYDEITVRNPNGHMYVNQALYIFILILNSGAMYLPYRVYDMLRIGYIFIIPYVIRSISDTRSRFLVKLAYLMVCVATFANFLTQPGNPYLNYQSAFSDWWNIINLP